MTEKKKDHLFKPGKSGNPGGRPKTPPEGKVLLKGYTVDAIKNLIGMASNPKDKHYYDANIEIMNRTMGKGQIDVEDNVPVQNVVIVRHDKEPELKVIESKEG